MKCLACNNSETVVKDSRASKDCSVIRRRRICTKCNFRFTTFEAIQLKEMKVIKESGGIQLFNREKLYHSIEVATRKRPVTKENIEMMVNNVLCALENTQDNIVRTKVIGSLVMEELAKVDLVAYIRFASVYLNFSNIEDFIKVIKQFYK